jgi:hypothetical protein
MEIPVRSTAAGFTGFDQKESGFLTATVAGSPYDTLKTPSTKGWTGAARRTRTTSLPSVTANRAWPLVGGLCCRAQGSGNRAFANHPKSLQVPGLMGNLKKISRPP